MPITPPLAGVSRMAGVGQIDEEYLLGPDVLVAPVVTEGATTRAVAFPPGRWRRPKTGE